MAANISRLTGDARRVELLRAKTESVLTDRVTATEAFGTAIAWTPTVTQGVTLTLAGNISFYTVLGDWVFGSFQTGFSSTGTAGNPVRVSLPVAAAVAEGSFGVGSIYDDSAASRFPALFDMTSTTQFWFADSTQASGTWALGTVTFTAALTTNDGISGSFMYRAA